MTWWSGHKVVDPTELEARFSNEDSMAFMDAVVYEAMSEEGEETMKRVKKVVERLPPREADFIDLYYFKNIKQTDIAAIFGVSQPTVCYRLQRAASRIHFLMTMPSFTSEELVQAITPILKDPVDIDIMRLMFESTCQSEVAKQLNVSQGFVRHRFLRTVEKMRKHGGMDEYVKAFDLIAANLNILREVSRPNLDPRIIRIVS